MTRLLFTALIALLTTSAFAGELIHVGQKYKDRQGHAFYPLTFSVYSNFLDHCAENDGAGRFDTQNFGATIQKRFSCSVMLAPLQQLRDFDPARLLDTFSQFTLPNGDPRKQYHQSHSLVKTLRNGATLRGYSNGVGFIFMKAGFTPIYINGVRTNFEGFDRPVDGHYMGFQVTCSKKTDEDINLFCSDADMLEHLRGVAPIWTHVFTTNGKVPRGHPEFEESPYGI